MNNKETKITVTIYGNEYRLKSPLSVERVQRLARELDRMMRETATSNPHLASNQVSVLVALRLLAEYKELQDKFEKGYQMRLFPDDEDKII